MGKCIRGHAVVNSRADDFNCKSCVTECIFRNRTDAEAYSILSNHKCWECEFWIHQGFGIYRCTGSKENCPREEIRNCFICHKIFIIRQIEDEVLCNVCKEEWKELNTRHMTLKDLHTCMECSHLLVLKNMENLGYFFQDFLVCSHCEKQFIIRYEKENGRRVYIFKKRES
jgi:hypothetical protein